MNANQKIADANPIKEVWDLLGARQKQFVESFYGNLFHQFPDYEKHFPQHMNEQTERMMELVGSVAQFSNCMDLIRPYLLKVGAAHKEMEALTVEDLRNFRDVFIATAASVCGNNWEEQHTLAFREVFDDAIIPIIDEGIRS